jgi:glutathione S-transferase
MAKLTIYGASISNFVRTARMTCVEKGVPYELVQLAPGKSMDGAEHPFGKIPFARHTDAKLGDFDLWETSAITRYIDRNFPGPGLQPTEARALARMDMWISACSHYIDQAIIRELVIPRLVHPMRGIASDEAKIAQAKPKVAHHLGVVETALASQHWLAGDALTLADLFLAPRLFWLGKTPEGPEALAGKPAIARWQLGIESRASFRDTMPQMPAQRAA